MRITALDRALSWASPRAALRRVQARAALELLTRHYEGAAVGRRTQNWRAPSTSATAALAPALVRLRDRARDLGRNNPWARNAIRVIRANVKGSGIRPDPQADTAGAADRARSAWRDWAETTECDADGRLNLYGLQGLAIKTMAESGEVLVLRRRRRSRDGLTVPIQLQLLEPDHLDVSRDRMDSRGNRVIQGVQFNALGRREGYWLYPDHPGDMIRGSFASVFWPAEDVLHAYPMDRVGQVRGVPLGCAVLIMLRDFDEYADATLLKQKIAACFAGFVEDSEFAEALGEAAGPDSDIDTLSPGVVEHLPPGKKITFPSPPVNADYEPYSRTQLRAIAAGYGVSYESLTGDLSQTNFISGRLGLLREHANTLEWQQDTVLPQLCAPIWRWFVEAGDYAGLGIGGVGAGWTTPRRVMVDPAQEVKGQREAIRAGLTTLSETLRENGWEPEEALDEMETDAAALDARGLVLDSDPRRTSAQGQAQDEPAAASQDAGGGPPAAPAANGRPAARPRPGAGRARTPR